MKNFSVFVLTAALAWFANVCKFALLIVAAAPVDTLFISRGIGIVFAPLGVVLGFV